MNNYEKIMAMSLEELAEFIVEEKVFTANEILKSRHVQVSNVDIENAKIFMKEVLKKEASNFKKMNEREILKKAISKYGLKNQIIKTVEELSELQQALCKNVVKTLFRHPSENNNLENIFEEIADVEIMLEQCKMIFECFPEVEKWKMKKIDRLEKRLSKEV